MSSQSRVLTSMPRSKSTLKEDLSLSDDPKSIFKHAYNQQCLNGSMNSSYKFLEDCTYKVDLQKLYQLKSTCYFNLEMPYCPVLVRVSDDLLKFNDNYRYLLQVWDENNRKIYEKFFKYEVTVWNIFFNFLIFKPVAPDADHDYFHIVNLEKSNTTYLVKDFTNGDKNYKHVGFDNGVFYVGNLNQIKLLQIDDFDEDDGGEHEVKFDDSQISIVVPDGHKIHGFFINEKMAHSQGSKNPCILVALETADNQIDLNQLFVLQPPGSETFDYQFRQFRPIVPRKSAGGVAGFDPITKYQLVFNEDQRAVSVAMRKSGRVDFYYDGLLCMSQNVEREYECFAHDVEVSFDETFFFATSNNKELEARAVTKSVNHELKSRMSSSDARELPEYKISNVFYQRVKKHCKIFKGFVFLKTYIFVAHGQMLSLYDMKALKFTKHMKFEKDIVQVFRSKVGGISNGNEGGEDEKASSDFDVCVLLQDPDDTEGIIKFINQRNPQNKAEGERETDYEIDETLTININGKVLQFDQDRDDNEWTFMLLEHANQVYSLKCLHNQKIYDISDSFLDHTSNIVALSEDTNFVFFFSPKDVTEVMIHQKEWFYVYEIDFDEEGQDINVKSLEKRRNMWVDLTMEEKDREEMDLVEEGCDLHSIIRVNNMGSLMIMSDSEYFYVLDMSNPDYQPMKYEQRCAGLFLSDNNYMYTLTHKNLQQGIQSGFRLYDIENCISKAQKHFKAVEALANQEGGEDAAFHEQQNSLNSQDTFMSYHLQSVQVGCQGLIDFSHQNQRLVYQSSYDSIEIVPVLHRNTIAFVGMENREDYLATKVVKDKFVALDKRNELSVWDIVTGKLATDKEFNIKTGTKGKQDYANYEIYTFGEGHYAYHQDWASRVLLKSKTPVAEDLDENQFYDPSMIRVNMKNQISYIKSLHKVFYEFKLIEIVNDKEVKEHLSFIFPHYEQPKVEEKKKEDSDDEDSDEKEVNNQTEANKPKEAANMQHLFFSADMQFMLERLVGARAFLYKRVHNRDRTKETSVRWELVHRFTQFPTDLCDVTQYPFIFSPDFNMYLDVDRKNKQFLVRDSFTQECRFVFPDYVMSCKEETIATVSSRFMWADNQTVKIISGQGVERKIALIEDKATKEISFKEEKFNVVQLFDVLSYVYAHSKNHMYLDKCQVSLQDTYNRLRLKYAQFRTAYYLDEKRQEQLYPSLFTVDYGVDSFKGRYVADLSFTFLHWNLMEKLKSGAITVDQIDQSQFQKLVYNILPRGETVFHRLSSDGNKLIEVMKACHPNTKKEAIPAIETHMPFIENFLGKSPLDLLLEASDFRTGNMMLQYLAAYGIDHHSRAVVKKIPLCISKKLPNMSLYLDSRLKQTKECRDFTKGVLLQENVNTPGVTIASFALSTETESIIVRKQVESDLYLEYFDMPILHQYDQPICNEFFNALAETEDMSIFNNKGIQKLVEYRWPLASEFVIKRLFFPFVAFLITFIAYMGMIYEWRQDEDPFYKSLNDITMIIILTEAIYFISIEIYQLFNNGLDYFSSFWNYLDLIPPILLLIFIPLALNGTFDKVDGVKQNQTLEASLQATMSLLLWLKLLYFLRIFRQTGYLIKIIIAVCIDMKEFLFILLLTIMAFGDSMRAISTSNMPQHVFIQDWWQSFTYVYRMILGDFNTDPTTLEGGPILLPEGENYTDPNQGFGMLAPYYIWTLFYFCTVLNMIIMLNLLIAIISESFARINQEKEQASFQEKCDIIAENSYLIPMSRKIGFTKDQDRYLLIATDIQQELDSQTKDTNFLLKETHRKIVDATVALENRLKDEVLITKNKNDDIIARRLDAIIKDNQEILSLVQKLRD